MKKYLIDYFSLELELVQCKDGEKKWKIRLLLKLTLVLIKILTFLEFLMVMEVFISNLGNEVAFFIRDNFIKEFLLSEQYQKGDIKASLVSTFFRMDELMKNPEGKQRLRELFSQSQKKMKEENFSKQNKQINIYSELFNPLINQEFDVAYSSGCTSCVAVIQDNIVYFANCGDSRAIVFCNKKQIQITTDHKPNIPKESERILKAKGQIAEGRIKGIRKLTKEI